jgi:hypothetical protein
MLTDLCSPKLMLISILVFLVKQIAVINVAETIVEIIVIDIFSFIFSELISIESYHLLKDWMYCLSLRKK